MIPMSFCQKFRFLLGALPLVALAACQKSAAPPEQVVAQGKDFELTIHEYDQALRQSPPVTAEAVQPMREAILEALVDEKLLAQSALSHDLDETPGVAQELQAAQRSILAKAFVRRLTGGTYRPREEDLREYYDKHPLQFANRKRFVVSEIVLKSDSPKIRDYIASFEKGGMASLGQVEDRPGLSNMLSPIKVVRYSDDIAGPALANVPRLAIGSQVVYQTLGQVHLGQIEDLNDDPVPFEEAKPALLAALTEERKNRLVKAAIKKERDERKVAIVSDTLKSVLGKTSMAEH
jgi:EpsD family peptidyl-prolyl cis-trans isomerase